MKTVAILQARMGSSRLPGKILLDLAGTSVLGRVVERARAIAGVDEVVVATTVDPRDEVVVEEAERVGAFAFRGSEEDVLARYLGAARQRDADLIVRITSDCPLLDPVESARVVAALAESLAGPAPADYASNTLRRTLPRGLDTEAFTRAALERAAGRATAPREREHVTLHLYEHPRDFRLLSVESDLDAAGDRWTVDTPEDYALVHEIYRRLGPTARIFPTRSVLALLDREPGLRALNAHVEQKKV